MGLIKELIYRLRGDYTTEKLVKMGMKVGSNFQRMKGCYLDPSHCWLIDIGDSVTLAPNVSILCHDASTKMFIGYTKIGNVTIGNHVFIGINSTILPGIKVGNNVIIGANSVVTHDIPDGVVCAGNPAQIISSLNDYLKKEQARKENSPVFESEYTLGGSITDERKLKQKRDLKNGIGFIK